MSDEMKARIVIHYCNRCGWQLRAAWLAQEILTTFEQQIEEVALRPGDNGVFEIWAGEVLIWERKRDNGFPDAKTLKLRLRDEVFTEVSLGKHLESH